MFICLEFHTLASKQVDVQCAWVWLTSSSSLGSTVESATRKEKKIAKLPLCLVLLIPNISGYFQNPDLGMFFAKKLFIVLALPW